MNDVSAPPRACAFVVEGLPVAQGSKSAFVVNGRAVVTEQGRAKLKPWRAEVRAAAREAMGEQPLLEGPLHFSVRFTLPRPKAHYTGGDPAKGLRDDAPEYVAKRPDVDKLLRAVADALTGAVYRDDAQLAQVLGSKVYGDTPRAVVYCEAL